MWREPREGDTMQKGFSFVFDIGNVLFTHELSRDGSGEEVITFAPIEEGLIVLKECHAMSERDSTLILACTNLKKYEIDLLKQLFPDTLSLFHGIVSPDVALYKKPDTRMFQYLLSAYDLIPHQTVFFDDLIRNVEAARSVGMKGIHVEDSLLVRKALKQHIPTFEG